ncbi:MAG: hypothetical protein KGO53_01870 [Alphaproteobacteria bacterium]|nr:hypothetical protein [Alphaproteobacteria bacterium]
MLALAAPVLLGGAGMAVDFGTYTMKANALQAAADEAATAGTRELALTSSTDTSITASVTNLLNSNLQQNDASATPTVTINRAKGTVTVRLSEAWTPVFAHFLNAGITPVIASATGMLQGESRLCILALHGSDPFTFNMMKNAHVQAATCSVYSNSTSGQGMTLQNASSINAAVICSAGGVIGTGYSTSVKPQTDCQPLADPLAGRAAPAVGACTATNFKVTTGAVSLSPGVYCGGINISGTAIASFNPGTYIIKDGFFYIGNSAQVTGTNVGFYLTGKNALLWFLGTASINLSGAESGPLAGLLFFGDRTMNSPIPHIISASNVHQLTGTIYFPSTNLWIDPNGNVAEASAYTAIIALHMVIDNGPNLVLNTNYGATAVPVPDGVRSTSTVVLSN